ncbi:MULTISPECIES: VOC family protein [Xanthomonas]|uniref:VOC family protein n=1 Tax=Xanthomonas TaxID=338 RepID=UPI001ADB1C88|nr:MULTISPECIES: VOC family protein [unclassified Xanthomonas]MBO9875471.1 glyoxalase [Xanthomonas sp. D-93]WNH44248.1 glyoxalase [Xanthomonas sp. A6251]
MDPLHSLELKVFVPARDFAQSSQFYAALEFAPEPLGDGLTCFRHGDRCAFLLQDFYHAGLAHNLVLHLWVEDADAWWRRLHAADLAGRYGARLGEPEDRPWGMRDFTLHDPGGVLWRIGHGLGA